MGLCIAQTIIELHGDLISAESRSGGAGFLVTQPIA